MSSTASHLPIRRRLTPMARVAVRAPYGVLIGLGMASVFFAFVALSYFGNRKWEKYQAFRGGKEPVTGEVLQVLRERGPWKLARVRYRPPGGIWEATNLYLREVDGPVALEYAVDDPFWVVRAGEEVSFASTLESMWWYQEPLSGLLVLLGGGGALLGLGFAIVYFQARKGRDLETMLTRWPLVPAEVTEKLAVMTTSQRSGRGVGLTWTGPEEIEYHRLKVRYEDEGGCQREAEIEGWGRPHVGRTGSRLGVLYDPLRPEDAHALELGERGVKQLAPDLFGHDDPMWWLTLLFFGGFGLGSVWLFVVQLYGALG